MPPKSRQAAAKQKIRRTYGILERQFHRAYVEADRMKGITGDNLLQLLESRLDTVAYRMGFGASRTEARQIVRHNGILVNGIRVRMQQTDGSDVGARRLNAHDKPRKLGGVDRRQYAAISIKPFANAKHQRSFDERRPRFDEDVVELRPGLPADVNHVLESGGRHERHPRATPFEHRVGRDRRSVHDIAGPFRATWTGRVEIAPGEEDEVFVEIANSSMADVRISGEWLDAAARGR